MLLQGLNVGHLTGYLSLISINSLQQDAVVLLSTLLSFHSTTI